jgi:hypothetical protein
MTSEAAMRFASQLELRFRSQDRYYLDWTSKSVPQTAGRSIFNNIRWGRSGFVRRMAGTLELRQDLPIAWPLCFLQLRVSRDDFWTLACE